MPFRRPTSANISPTSPRGIIEIPINAFFNAFVFLRKKTPIYFPITAINRKVSAKYQNFSEVKSITLKFIDRPTITKNIGVNICAMGRMELFTFSKNTSSFRNPIPKGKINRRDSAIPAANEPKISGAPKRCER